MTEQDYGARLKAAREAQQLSLFEVAGHLHLLQSVVEAMEQGQQPSSVPLTFWRGYLRSYAAFLGVTLPELQSTAQPTTTLIQSGYREEQISSRHIWPITWLLGLLLLGLLGWWWQDNRQMPEPEPLNLQQLLVEPAALSAEPTTVSSSTEPATETQPTEVAVTAPVVDEAPKPVEPESNAVAAELLQLSFNGSCWLKVVDAQSKVLYMGTRGRSQTLELKGSLPYRLTLGNPQAVQMMLGGKPVDLSRYPSGRVARLTLGN